MKFIKFREHCEWEGESWNFWLQLDGNEKEIEKLKEKIKYRREYEIFDDVLDEKAVDVLVKNCGVGYLCFENKVVGKLNSDKIIFDEGSGNLYKGGIKEMFLKPKSLKR